MFALSELYTYRIIQVDPQHLKFSFATGQCELMYRFVHRYEINSCFGTQYRGKKKLLDILYDSEWGKKVHKIKQCKYK